MKGYQVQRKNNATRYERVFQPHSLEIAEGTKTAMPLSSLSLNSPSNLTNGARGKPFKDGQRLRTDATQYSYARARRSRERNEKHGEPGTSIVAKSPPKHAPAFARESKASSSTVASSSSLLIRHAQSLRRQKLSSLDKAEAKIVTPKKIAHAPSTGVGIIPESIDLNPTPSIDTLYSLDLMSSISSEFADFNKYNDQPVLSAASATSARSTVANGNRSYVKSNSTGPGEHPKQLSALDTKIRKLTRSRRKAIDKRTNADVTPPVIDAIHSLSGPSGHISQSSSADSNSGTKEIANAIPPVTDATHALSRLSSLTTQLYPADTNSGTKDIAISLLSDVISLLATDNSDPLHHTIGVNRRQELERLKKLNISIGEKKYPQDGAVGTGCRGREKKGGNENSKTRVSSKAAEQVEPITVENVSMPVAEVTFRGRSVSRTREKFRGRSRSGANHRPENAPDCVLSLRGRSCSAGREKMRGSSRRRSKSCANQKCDSTSNSTTAFRWRSTSRAIEKFRLSSTSQTSQRLESTPDSTATFQGKPLPRSRIKLQGRSAYQQGPGSTSDSTSLFRGGSISQAKMNVRGQSTSRAHQRHGMTSESTTEYGKENLRATSLHHITKSSSAMSLPKTQGSRTLKGGSMSQGRPVSQSKQRFGSASHCAKDKDHGNLSSSTSFPCSKLPRASSMPKPCASRDLVLRQFPPFPKPESTSNEEVRTNPTVASKRTEMRKIGSLSRSPPRLGSASNQSAAIKLSTDSTAVSKRAERRKMRSLSRSPPRVKSSSNQAATIKSTNDSTAASKRAERRKMRSLSRSPPRLKSSSNQAATITSAPSAKTSA